MYADLRKVYLTSSGEGAFGSVNRLYRAAKEAGLNYTQAQVKAFLQTQPTFQRHKRARYRYKRAKIRVYGLNELAQVIFTATRVTPVIPLGMFRLTWPFRHSHGTTGTRSFY